ncbi:MAG: helicase-exonuclease AddAB subunit AddA [Eubacterium sp.]|nr:helicase-exonuclease AddAB subunit AddA [Eubacterium sp.]
MNWTSKQLEVINTRNRNILVSAAAGSGKTAVLVERIIGLITDKKSDVNVDELLVVTFTRAAAAEMKERLRERLEELQKEENSDNIEKQLALLNNATITTIDSFCAKVVKENFDKINLDPGYRLADETEIDLLRNDVLEELLEEYYLSESEDFLTLAKKFSGGKVYDNIFRLVDTIYKKAKGEVSPEKWVKNLVSSYSFGSEEEMFEGRLFTEVYKICQRQISDCREKLVQAINIAEEDNDVMDLAENAEAFLAVVEMLLECSDYTQLHKSINHCSLPAISRKRKGTPEIRLGAKELITSVRDYIKSLAETFFAEPLEDMYQNVMNCKDTVQILAEITLKLMERFAHEKKDKHIADFDDIAHMALNILNDIDEKGNPHPTKVARQMAKVYKEIMIDEYQDSNFVQEAILTSVADGQGMGNMFMVGDVKQSIYRFRNAKPNLFLDKFDTYEEDFEADYCKIILDQNFRSRKEVIDSVNFLFEHIMSKELGGIDYRDGNGLRLGADYADIPKGQDNRTEFVAIGSDKKEMEAAFVAAKIKEITDPVKGMKVEGRDKIMRPARYQDIVILMRGIKSNANIYLEALSNAGIPAYAESKSGYFDSLEISTIMDMLNIIDNPRQDIPLVGVMSSAMFGFTDNELAVLKSENSYISFYDNVCAYAENGENETLVLKVKSFLKTLEYFRNCDYKNSVYDMINGILERTGFHYYVSALSNGKRRFLNIENLKEKAMNYEKSSYRGLFNFVRYIEKIKELDKDEGEASAVNENDNIVRISTIHKSKGLQFPIVFLCDTNSTFISDKEPVNITDDGQIGLDAIYPDIKVSVTPMYRQYVKKKNSEEDRAEYLRLLYVALTRAKEKLYITGKVGQDMEKYLKKCESIHVNTGKVLSNSELMNHSSLFQWMNLIFHRDNQIVHCVQVTEDEIEIEQAGAVVVDELKKAAFEQWENAEIPKDIYDTIVSNFEYKYPYEEDINLCAKASVTELKKESMEDEEAEHPYDIGYEKSDRELIVPKFMKENDKEEQSLFGAERGTAYHRVFELLDMECEDYTEHVISAMIEKLVEAKQLSQTQADCIQIRDIVKFTKSDVFVRMKEAYGRDELFRERQFLLGVPAKQIKKSGSEETMIIQGIIDVCFLEDGRYVIMDYKTDRVDNMEELKEKYAKQLECYQLALEKITGILVSEMIIYSVYLGDEIRI